MRGKGVLWLLGATKNPVLFNPPPKAFYHQFYGDVGLGQKLSLWTFLRNFPDGHLWPVH